MAEKDFTLLERAKNEKDPIKLSKILFQLTKKEGEKLINIARLLNKKPAYLSHLIRLNKLPELIIDGYFAKLISLSHLFVISRLNDEQSMVNVYERVLASNLNVSQTDELIRGLKYQISSKGKYYSKKEIDRINKQLQKNNIYLKLIQSRIKTKLIIEIRKNLYESEKILKKILEKLNLLSEDF
jgi:ParB-like chromosome segregation protein Spo0J